jgi:hypothetical protein
MLLLQRGPLRFALPYQSQLPLSHSYPTVNRHSTRDNYSVGLCQEKEGVASNTGRRADHAAAIVNALPAKASRIAIQQRVLILLGGSPTEFMPTLSPGVPPFTLNGREVVYWKSLRRRVGRFDDSTSPG